MSAQILMLKKLASESFSPSRAAERAAIYERVYAETQTEPQVMRAAKCLASFLREKELVLSPADVLAGHTQRFNYTYGVALGGWAAFLRSTDEPLEPGTNLIAMPDFPRVTPQETPFAYVGLDGSSRPAEEAAILEQFCKGIRMGLYTSWPGGHVIGGYHSVLAQGLTELARAASVRLANGATGSLFAQASLIVCKAATNYILRYAQKARELAAETTNAETRKRLARIADGCAWVAEQPPRTFFEAVQLLWLTHEIMICEQDSGSLSLGRIDQYLWPYYARDLAAGSLTHAEAGEIIEALWCKLAHRRRGFQNITLGGCRADGTYAANELTCICLRATQKLRMDQPLLSVRWAPGMPDEFWTEVQELIQMGLGFPALFNDDVVMKAKGRVDVASADVANYAIVGCVEPSVPGKEFAHTEALRVNWAKVLELMLQGGNCAVTGECLPLKRQRNLDSIGSWEEFYAWYRGELANFVNVGIRALNYVDRDWHQQLPYPFLSSTMEGCLEHGLDVTAGGTIYNLSSVNGLGMADVADSLVAIKRLVFEERRMALSGLTESLRQNFAGAAGLAELLSNYPRFGNDQGEPDAILCQLTADFCRQVDGFRNPRGGRFQTGLYSVDQHARNGKLMGALPTGRQAKVALANGLSPCQGVDTVGPTAVVISVTKLSHAWLGNGMVLDLKFHPTFFDNESRRRAFHALVETYFQLGGLEIQFNVISRETLLAAQRSPQDYRDLLVRVSGFSAYFVDLDRVCQDEIIARTEHGAI